MGFQEGSGLGKDGSGRSEPISIGIGNGRVGLGVLEEKRRAALEASALQKQQESGLRETFLDLRKRGFEVTKVTRELEKAQKACEELDVAAGILESELWASRDAEDGVPKSDSVIEVCSFLIYCEIGKTLYIMVDFSLRFLHR